MTDIVLKARCTKMTRTRKFILNFYSLVFPHLDKPVLPFSDCILPKWSGKMEWNVIWQEVNGAKMS